MRGLFLTLSLLPFSSEAVELHAQAGAYTTHFGGTRDSGEPFNEQNNLVMIKGVHCVQEKKCWTIRAGTLDNSISNRSYIFAGGFEYRFNEKWGVVPYMGLNVGYIDGYNRSVPLGGSALIGVNYGKLSIEGLITPPVGEIDAAGILVFSWKIGEL